MDVQDYARFGTCLVIGVFGNLLIILYFGFKDTNITTYKLFIVLLAITDFLLISSIAFYFLPSETIENWSNFQFTLNESIALVEIDSFKVN